MVSGLNLAAFCVTSPLTRNAIPTRRRLCTSVTPIACANNGGGSSASQSRRAFLASIAVIAASSTLAPPISSAKVKEKKKIFAPNSIVNTDTPPTEILESGIPGAPSVLPGKNPGEKIGYQTASGITFVEFATGEGRTPNWGDIVNIHFTLYTLTESKTDLIEHESSFEKDKQGYTLHHGNGEHILGLEEMIHTMRTGSKRRCIIPGPLAYTMTGMAPIPYKARDRKKFFNALNKADGSVVMDLELRWIAEDAADRGYYSDLVPTDEEILGLMDKIREEEQIPGIPSIQV